MKITNFDIPDYLDSKEIIAEYLNTVLEDGDATDLIDAIGNVSKAIGMSKIAEQTGMSRTSLYKALSKDVTPLWTPPGICRSRLTCYLLSIPLLKMRLSA